MVFEPDPHNCMLLRANVAINSGGSNVEIVNAAVAAEKGELGLVRSDYNSGDHYLSDHGEIRVPVVRLDDYPAAPGPFAVKIDTQGAEPAIFRGGGATLATAEYDRVRVLALGDAQDGSRSRAGHRLRDPEFFPGRDIAPRWTDRRGPRHGEGRDHLRALVAAGGRVPDAADLILTHRVTRA